VSAGRSRSGPGPSTHGPQPVAMPPTHRRKPILRGGRPLDPMGSGLRAGGCTLGPAIPGARSAVDVRHVHRPGPFIVCLSVRASLQDGARAPTVCATSPRRRRAVVRTDQDLGPSSSGLSALARSVWQLITCAMSGCVHRPRCGSPARAWAPLGPAASNRLRPVVRQSALDETAKRTPELLSTIGEPRIRPVTTADGQECGHVAEVGRPSRRDCDASTRWSREHVDLQGVDLSAVRRRCLTATLSTGAPSSRP